MFSKEKQTHTVTLIFRVPEGKCHMVLPDIDEEEDYDGPKLSLTSLLLESSNIVAHIGLGDLPAVQGEAGEAGVAGRAR